MSEQSIPRLVLQVLEVDPESPPPYDEDPSTLSESTGTVAPVDRGLQSGHQHHGHAVEKYVLPHDEPEFRRLELQHLIWEASLDGRLHLAPIPSTTQTALDIGCGTGAWACDFASQYPKCQVTGADLSSIQRSTRPPNVNFVIHDMTSTPWPFDKKFDYVHSRAINVGVKSWPNLIDIIWDNLEPGGWVEFQEYSMSFRSDDDSLSAAPAFMSWIKATNEVSKKLGIDIAAFAAVPSVFQATGFQNIATATTKFPIGPWPKGEREKRIGRMFEEDLIRLVETVSMRIYTAALGWTEDEVRKHVAEVVRDIKARKAHAYMQIEIVWGQKPAAV